VWAGLGLRAMRLRVDSDCDGFPLGTIREVTKHLLCFVGSVGSCAMVWMRSGGWLGVVLSQTGASLCSFVAIHSSLFCC